MEAYDFQKKLKEDYNFEKAHGLTKLSFEEWHLELLKKVKDESDSKEKVMVNAVNKVLETVK